MYNDNFVNGRSYFIEDGSNELILSLVKTFVGLKKPCFYICRFDQFEINKIRSNINIKIILMRRTKHEHFNTISDIDELKKTVMGFCTENKNPIFILNKIAYLVSHHSFDHFMQNLFQIIEIISDNESMFFLNLDTKIFDAKEISLMKSDLYKLPNDNTNSIKIDPELYNILDYLNKGSENMVSINHKKIKMDFRISYPTVAKRIKSLKNRGLIFTHIDGRKKTINISNKGKDLLFHRNGCTK